MQLFLRTGVGTTALIAVLALYGSVPVAVAAAAAKTARATGSNSTGSLSAGTWKIK